ncbi:MAG: hypothetical protein JWL62_3859 [Hyphomicrobiales bacterium]|nr:hypothetical protein [Hyphomicrobiales bacterium]
MNDSFPDCWIMIRRDLIEATGAEVWSVIFCEPSGTQTIVHDRPTRREAEEAAASWDLPCLTIQ